MDQAGVQAGVLALWFHIGSNGTRKRPTLGGWSLQIQEKARCGKGFFVLHNLFTLTGWEGWTHWESASDYTLRACAIVHGGRASPSEVLQVLCTNLAFLTRRS